MKTIVEMTREAGGFDATPEFLERFEAIVRADERDKWMERAHTMILGEREAFAKVADLVAREIDDTNGTATYISAAIRARGNT